MEVGAEIQARPEDSSRERSIAQGPERRKDTDPSPQCLLFQFSMEKGGPGAGG
jgi:hypothetical protein